MLTLYVYLSKFSNSPVVVFTKLTWQSKILSIFSKIYQKPDEIVIFSKITHFHFVSDAKISEWIELNFRSLFFIIQPQLVFQLEHRFQYRVWKSVFWWIIVIKWLFSNRTSFIKLTNKNKLTESDQIWTNRMIMLIWSDLDNFDKNFNW